MDTARQEKYEISLKLQVPVLLNQTPRIVVQMRIRIRIQAYKYRLKNLKRCSNSLIFCTFWPFICELTRIWTRIQLISPDPVYHVDADPDPDPTFQFYADPDPQHCGVFASSIPTSQDSVLMNNATSRIMPALLNKIFKLQIFLAQSPARYFAPKVQIFCSVSR